MSQPNFSNRNSYTLSHRGSQVSTPNLPRFNNASPFLPPILAPPNLSYRRSVEALPRIGPPQGLIALPFPPMTFLPPEMDQMSQKRKKQYDLEKGIEKVIGAIDQQSNILKNFAKALKKKKEDHEKHEAKQLKRDIEKIKRATTLQYKIDSQQQKFFNRILASQEFNRRASAEKHDNDSSKDSSLDRLTNAVYKHKIKTILQKKKKKKLQEKTKEEQPIMSRRVTMKDDSIDAYSKNYDREYEGSHRYDTERGRSVPRNTPRTNSPRKSILINSPLKTKKRVEFNGIDDYDYEDPERFVRLSDKSPLKARILERRNTMERNRSRGNGFD